MKRIILFLFFSFIFLIDANAQCAMCRAVLETGESQDIAKGINDGIVYLMAVPYILIAGIGFFIYRKFNNSKKN
ncbi:MAG TPA: hypothetical protein VKY41_04050 [Xanthomarina sp.]|nr:hypothetical protein [Xanthomarina sp.]